MSKVEKKLPDKSEAKLPDTLSEKGVQTVRDFGWPYFKAGIVLVNCRNEFLLVKEAKVKRLVNGQET